MKHSNLKKLLNKSSVNHSPMSRTEVLNFQQIWREIFSKSVKEQKGKWKYRGFDWHTFSYDFATYESGAKAIDTYNKINEPKFIIISEDEDSLSFSCLSDKLPDLSDLFGDYYVFPETMEWTMVYTHEDGLGPFFARKEWQ